jgi:hypothetical protein
MRSRCDYCGSRGDTFPRRTATTGTVKLCSSCKRDLDSVTPSGDQPATKTPPKMVRAMGSLPAPAYRPPTKRRWL